MSDSQHTDLLPAYLAVGEDALKREAVIARLKARLATMGDLSFNSDEFDGEVAKGAAIAAACNTMPFASPVRLVYVRNVDKLKKADAEELVNYLKAPSATTVLACEAEKLARNTRLYKALAAAGPKAVIDCAPPKSWELPKRVRAMACTHGITLTEGAASALVELVGENTVHLDNELKKIALAHGTADGVGREVRALVARFRGEAVGFHSRLRRAKPRKVSRLRSKMESTSPHALIALCTTRLRELMAAVHGPSRQPARAGQRSARPTGA
ncbi:MAG: DNA polymerase III subunit delta [Adlercreutzia equolifaciens]